MNQKKKGTKHPTVRNICKRYGKIYNYLDLQCAKLFKDAWPLGNKKKALS